MVRLISVVGLLVAVACTLTVAAPAPAPTPAPDAGTELASFIDDPVNSEYGHLLEKRKKTTKKTTKKKTTKKTTKKKTTKKTTKKKTTKKTTKKKTTKTTKKSSKTTAKKSNHPTYGGTATWFIPETEGGVWGACGPKESSSSKIVALNKSQYGNMSKKSKWCGKKIRITGPSGKSVVATVNDACPGCKHGDLDLTPILFKQIIGNMNKGIGKIKWTEI